MSTKIKSSLNGVVLVASGAIGAGMFSLPIVSAGMWFGWTIVCLILVWLANLYAAFVLLETNLKFKPGASFDTLVGQTLGKTWNALNNISIAFVMYILLYAYFSASGSIVEQTYPLLLSEPSPISQNLSNVLFGAVIALMVSSGASMVSRICSVLLIGMVISFFLTTSGLLLHIEVKNLIVAQTPAATLPTYIWAALPFFVTSFACSGIIPSLVKFYGHDEIKIKRSLIYGTLISLLIYSLWVLTVFGTINRDEIAPVISAGGNIGDLVNALQVRTDSSNMSLMVNLFSNFAIASSFLSIGLGLFDYIADKFSFGNTLIERSKSAVLTFLPPAILSYLFPHGFIIAIGYAGLVVLFSFYIVPIAMAFKKRLLVSPANSKLLEQSLLISLLIFSLAIAVIKILTIQNIIPVYP